MGYVSLFIYIYIYTGFVHGSDGSADASLSVLRVLRFSSFEIFWVDEGVKKCTSNQPRSTFYLWIFAAEDGKTYVSLWDDHLYRIFGFVFWKVIFLLSITVNSQWKVTIFSGPCFIYLRTQRSSRSSRPHTTDFHPPNGGWGSKGIPRLFPKLNL